MASSRDGVFLHHRATRGAGKGVCENCRWWCNPPGSRGVEDLRGDDSLDPNGWQVVERRLARDHG